jgi:hypothetical protein
MTLLIRLKPCHFLLLACNLFSMQACPRCNKKPAKRFCPALRTKICAVCCARERMIALACPESCSYLIEARSSARQRERLLLQKEAATNPRDLSLTERSLLALNIIEQAIVNTQRGVEGTALRDLTDEEVFAAVENAIKNAETEQSGLIYEHGAGSPRIAEVSRRIRQALEKMSAEIPAEARPRRSDALKALTFTREAVKAHMRRAVGDADASRGYVRYVTLFSPWPEEATRPILL